MYGRAVTKAAVALWVLAACGGSPSKPVSKPAEPPRAAQPEWWCVSFNRDMNGLCLAGKPACDAMLANLRASATDKTESIGDCARSIAPVCLDKTVDNKRELVCHPTVATCRSHASYLATEGATVSECRSSDPKAAAEPRWWCVAYEPASIGSCTRSLKDCEGSRDFLRGKLPGETIECAPRQAAECVDFEVNGKQRQLCHPSTTTCKATVATMAEDGAVPTAGCHAVD